MINSDYPDEYIDEIGELIISYLNIKHDDIDMYKSDDDTSEVERDLINSRIELLLKGKSDIKEIETQILKFMRARSLSKLLN